MAKPFVGPVLPKKWSPTSVLGVQDQPKTTQPTQQKTATGGSAPSWNDIVSGVKTSGVLQGASENSGPSNKEIDSIYKPQMDFLNQYSQTLTNRLPTLEQGFQGDRDVAVNSVNQQGQTQQMALDRQEQGVNSQTNNAVAEQRRQFAEVQRGIQAQYGGTTGTGAFAAEIAGAGAMGNVARIREGGQSALKQIGDAEISLQNDIKDKVFQLDQQLNNAKKDARMWLEDKISEINSRKADMEGAKAEKKLDALREYKLLNAQIEQANKQYLQGMYSEYQNKVGEFSKLKDNVVNAVNEALTSDTSGGLEEGGEITEPKPGSEQSGIYQTNFTPDPSQQPLATVWDSL